MYKLDLGKAEEPEIKLPTSVGSQTKMQGNSRGSLGNACCSPPRSQSWGHANFPFQAYGVSELHASPWQPLVLQCVARAIPCPGPVTFRGSGFLRVGRVALQWKGRFSLRVMLVAQDPWPAVHPGNEGVGAEELFIQTIGRICTKENLRTT